MRSKIAAIVALIVIIGLMAVKLVLNKMELNSKNQPKAEGRTLPVSVTVIPAKISPASKALTKTGSLLPFQEVDITSTAQGKLSDVRFELGKKVKKGEVLALVDSELRQLQLRQTELSIKKLEEDLARFQSLLAGDAATQMQVNEIKYNYENAKVQAEQIRKQISDATIVAPANGIITRKNFEEGEFVNPGFNLGMVVDVTRLKAQVQLTEDEVYGVKEGQDVNITSDILPGRTLEGKVNYVSPKGDDTHNYLAEITLQNDSGNSLKAGTFVYVNFDAETDTSLMQIPRAALVQSIRNPYVYVVEDSVAYLRNIKVGREFGTQVEVLDGLKENELVVTTGQINLADKSVVKIVR